MRSLPPSLAALALALANAGCATDLRRPSDPVSVAPAAVIDAPADGAAFATTDLISLVGTISDGNGLDDLASVSWSSSQSGELATSDLARPDADGVTRASVVLPAGSHRITLRATDRAGLSAEASIQLDVGEVGQGPTAVIDAPAPFAQFLPGDAVDLRGSVSDAEQPPDTLAVAWQVRDNTNQAVIATLPGAPTSSGATSASWAATRPGNYVVALDATDDEGNTATGQALILVLDPDIADLDHDGVSLVGGDCDDHDPSVRPGADETCADVTDNDCNGVVDDKDLDHDAHIDDTCVDYPGGLPIDDCDDASAATYGGAYELPDRTDNDCDGQP